jgi:hypothetical protein
MYVHDSRNEKNILVNFAYLAFNPNIDVDRGIIFLCFIPARDD